MVLVFLGPLQFEAIRFETRTMPTPNMKGKEVIYWIRVETEDRQLATDLQRYLDGTSKAIELRVPSAFIAVKTELEEFIPPERSRAVDSSRVLESRPEKTSRANGMVSEKNEEVSEDRKREQRKVFNMEFILRRTVQDRPAGQSQSPYG